MASLKHILYLSVILVLLCQTKIVFGASASLRESNDFTCFSCIGDQNSTCATDPENATQSHWGGDADDDPGTYNSSTVPCKDQLKCVTLVLSGQVNDVDTTMYYRNCLIDCELLKAVVNIIPLNIVDNPTLVSCDSCGKTNCNTNDYSDPGDSDGDDDDPDNNSATITQSVLMLMTPIVILSTYF